MTCNNKCKNCKGNDCPYGTDLIDNKELVRKLLERTTFFGIVVSSINDPHSTNQDFIVSFNGQISATQASSILLSAAEALLQNQTQ
jgi:hypothetical protein